MNVVYLLKHDKKKLSEYILQCMDVLDEAFEDLYGTSPLSDKQKKREMDTVFRCLYPSLQVLF